MDLVIWPFVLMYLKVLLEEGLEICARKHESCFWFECPYSFDSRLPVCNLLKKKTRSQVFSRILFIFDEHCPVRIVHIGYFLKKQERLKYCLFCPLTFLKTSNTFLRDNIDSLLLKSFTIILVAKINPQSRWLTQVKSVSGSKRRKI